ncbi:MAG: hypothetical protein WAW80_01845 [Candidatus Saccharimonadales bacterium]
MSKKSVQGMKYDARIMEILNEAPAVGSADKQILEALKRIDQEKIEQSAELAERFGSPRDDSSSRYKRPEIVVDFRPTLVPRSTYNRLTKKATPQS